MICCILACLKTIKDKVHFENRIIYLDNNSTTKTDDRVIEKMIPFMRDLYGNPSSSHFFGRKISQFIEEARDNISHLLNCDPLEIIFTSGATESINLALMGVSQSYDNNRKKIVTISTEHKAVLETCKQLEKQGFEVIYLPVKVDGTIDLNLFTNSVDSQTLLVIAMFVNNEIGVIHDIKVLSEIAHNNGALFFCDATQATGKVSTDVEHLNVDMLCFSGHKFHGPKGIGGLFVKKSVKKKLKPQHTGGTQEYGIRSGTLNSIGIIGLGEASRISYSEMNDSINLIQSLRDYLENELLKIPGTFINGSVQNRIYNTSNLCFTNNDANIIIGRLKNIALSNGSACTSSIIEPSHVLKAIGLSDDLSFSAIRFSLSKYNSKIEIDEVIKEIKNILVDDIVRT
jgi:cysteine desulfurase